MNWLTAIWPWLWHFGVAGGVVAGAIALAWLTPFKKTFLAIAGAAAIFLAGHTIGVKDGKHYLQTRWDNAERVALNRGAKARDAAELAIPPLRPGDTDPRPSAGRVCIDRFDRDCH